MCNNLRKFQFTALLQGIKDRDEFVFTEVRAKRKIPILMLQGGGFQVKPLINNKAIATKL